MILVLVEKSLDGAAVEVSLETLTFARSLSEADPGLGRIHFFWLPSAQPGFCSLPRCMCRLWPHS